MVAYVAGDIAEHGGWFVWLLAGAGVKVGLESRKDGDEQVNVVDTQTHLEEGTYHIENVCEMKCKGAYISRYALKFDIFLLVTRNSIWMQTCTADVCTGERDMSNSEHSMQR